MVTTRRDILLLPQTVNFLRLRNGNAIHVAFRRIACPKVVQIIVSYNNLRAFFAIFRVFGSFLCDFRVRRLAVRRRRRAARAFRRVAVRHGGASANCATRRVALIHMRQQNAVRRTARAAAFASRRPATRFTLVRDLRRLLPEYLNNIRYLLCGQKVTEKPPR